MPIKNSKKALYFFLTLFLLFSVFIFSGCLKNREKPYVMNLEIWGIFDDSDVFYEINNQYRKNNPQIKDIRYKKISNDIAVFEKELTDAIASGNGPDIIFFKDTWLSEHKNKIAALPESGKHLTSFKNNFIDIAQDDFVEENQIYAMPLYCDTLALFYNKDLFNQRGITSPPKTWKELSNNYVDYLTAKDSNGNITQSAIALGRSKNPGGINRSSDILTLMMMQNGIELYDPGTKTMRLSYNSKTKDILDYYTKFASNDSDDYTWNSLMDYSIDSFKSGKTAMMVNYSYWKNKLKEESPKLNFDTAEMLQEDLQNKVNFANYWGLAVVKNKQLQPINTNTPINFTQEDRINEAWKYIQYLTMKPDGNAPSSALLEFDPNEKYLENTLKPAARRDLIEKQKSDSYIDNFAIQGLTAKSWSQPKNNVVEEAFEDMINEVATGQKTSYEALKTAETRINNSIKE